MNDVNVIFKVRQIIRESPIGFSGSGISFIWSSGFGIVKQNPGSSGWKVCARVKMPEITVGITGLHELFGWDYGIEEPYWVASHNTWD